MINEDFILEYRRYIWSIFNQDIRGNPDKNRVYLLGKLVTEFYEFKCELEDSISTKDKIIKEVGDCIWHLANYLSLSGIDWVYSTEGTMDLSLEDLLEDFEHLMVFAVDKQWKHQFHGKPLAEREVEKLVDQMLNDLVEICKVLEIDFQLVLQTNMDKLRERHGQNYNPSYYKGN